jgi:hypothetical protein
MRQNVTHRKRRAGREWLGLRELTEYAAVSGRTLRAWIHLPVDPLPAACPRGKFLIKLAAFDAWLAKHTVKPAKSVDAPETKHEPEKRKAVSVTAIQS